MLEALLSLFEADPDLIARGCWTAALPVGSDLAAAKTPLEPEKWNDDASGARGAAGEPPSSPEVQFCLWLWVKGPTWLWRVSYWSNLIIYFSQNIEGCWTQSWGADPAGVSVLSQWTSPSWTGSGPLFLHVGQEGGPSGEVILLEKSNSRQVGGGEKVRGVLNNRVQNGHGPLR